MRVTSTQMQARGGDLVKTDILAQWKGAVGAPISAWTISVPTGGSTLRHNHHDTEFWVVVSGNGLLRAGDEDLAITCGDVVCLEPLLVHEVHNASNDSPLTFVSVWWDSPEALSRQARSAPVEHDFPPAPLLLPAFPTPNGDLHLGHLSGPYLGADVYARCARLQGVQCNTLLGSIGHMNHVAIAARGRAETYYQTAEHFTNEIQATVAAYSMASDVFVRPVPTPEYERVLADVFNKLKAGGYIRKRALPTQHCARCARFCFEAEVSGVCLFCKSTSASGNDCEGCARHHADHELIAPHCRYCGEATEPQDFERYFLDLELLRPALQQFSRRANMSSDLRRFADWVLDDPLPSVAISHIADFGVLVPGEPEGGQRIASTFEHAARLIEAVRQLNAGMASGTAAEIVEALATGERSLVVFFGWDNAFMRVILFPALLIAYLDGKLLPAALFTNRFLTLNGSKFSTSRNHAIWGRDILARADVNAVRWYLALVRSEGFEADFDEADFNRFLGTSYRGTLGGWFGNLDTLAQKFGGQVPEAGPWDASTQAQYADVLAFHARALRAASHGAFSPRRLAIECLHFMSLVAANLRQQLELLRQCGADSVQTRTHGALAFMSLRSFVLFISPLMPGLANDLVDRLGLGKDFLHGGERLDVPVFFTPGMAVPVLGTLVHG